MFKYAFFLFTVFGLVSCATFSKRLTNSNRLFIEDYSDLNGSYLLIPTQQYDKRGKPTAISDGKQLYNFYNVIKKENIEIDSIEKNWFEIKANKDSLNCFIYLKDTLSKSFSLKGKIKKGYLYLDNKTLDCHGVPYLFGGCNHQKQRIGKSLNNNLLLQTAVDNTGAFLFIIGSGYRYNSLYQYKRMD